MKLLNKLVIPLLSLALSTHGAVKAKATYYAHKFNGHKMANGKVFRSDVPSVATNDFPLGTMLDIFNPQTGKHLYLTVTDRSKKTRYHHIDLSLAAFKALGLSVVRGSGKVLVKPLKWVDVR